MQSQKSKPKAGAARRVDPAVAERERSEFAGDAPPPTQQWLTRVNTAAYLGVSTMSVERYANEPSYAHLNFPKPSIVVDRSYWNRDDLDKWMRSRVGAVSTRRARAGA